MNDRACRWSSLRLFNAADRNSRSPSGVIGGYAPRLIVVLHQREVRVDLTRKVVLRTPHAKQVQHTFEKSTHVFRS
jgi:hypothetical protein